MTALRLLSEARKFGLALVGLIAQAIELGLLHDNILHWAQLVTAAIDAGLIYQVPNKPKPTAD